MTAVWHKYWKVFGVSFCVVLCKHPSGYKVLNFGCGRWPK